MGKARFDRLKVSHYKSLESASVDFENFSVVVGANNSGKSNFLETTNLLEDIFFRGQEGKNRVARKLGSVSQKQGPAKPTKIELVYTVSEADDFVQGTYVIELEKNTEDDKKNLKIINESLFFKSMTSTGPAKKLFERTDQSVKLRATNSGEKAKFKDQSIADDVSAIELIQSIYPKPSDAPDVYPLLLFPILSFSGSPVFRPHDMSKNYLKEIMDALPELFSLEERKDQRYTLFSEALSEILNIEMIQINKFNIPNAPEESEHKDFYMCFLKEKYKKDITMINDMSDGTRLLFLMLYHLFISEKRLILIDEPEVGLHPNAIFKLFELLQKGLLDKQIMVSTHSSFLINLINPKNVTLAEPNEMGLSTFKPVLEIENLTKRLKSKYVNFGDLFANNFKTGIDTSL